MEAVGAYVLDYTKVWLELQMISMSSDESNNRQGVVTDSSQ